jgi:hypothetical protein
MVDTDRQWIAERDAVPGLLRENRRNRELLEGERKKAREELAELVVRGYRVALSVAEMARGAGVSRETIHTMLREAGEPTWRDRSGARSEARDGE